MPSFLTTSIRITINMDQTHVIDKLVQVVDSELKSYQKDNLKHRFNDLADPKIYVLDLKATLIVQFQPRLFYRVFSSF